MSDAIAPESSAELVSVVIAAYKSDSFLEEAIRDALGQTYRAIEVIVSDDAASSDTFGIVTRFGDARVSYRANPTRLGACGNHWAAFRAAHGQWVAILNHDDRWDPNFLTRMMSSVAENPDAVLAFCDHNVISAAGELRRAKADELSKLYGRAELIGGRQPSLPRLVLRQSIPMAMGSVFRKSAVDLTELPDIGPAYDLWLTYLLARSGGTAVYVPARLTSWREHPNNLTSAGDLNWVAGAAKCWAEMAHDPVFGPLQPLARRAASRAARRLAIQCLRGGERAAARLAALAAVGYCRTNVRAVFVLLLTLFPTTFIRWAVSRQ